jgi:hypothetical protein
VQVEEDADQLQQEEGTDELNSLLNSDSTQPRASNCV